MAARYHLKLHGPFEFGPEGAESYSLGAKQQALIALLVDSPSGSRTRVWLQEILWSNVQSTQAKGSLRNALSQIRGKLGEGADDLLQATRDKVSLNLSLIDQTGGPEDGDFLEGLELRNETAFRAWLTERRADIRAARRLGPVEPVIVPANGAGPDGATMQMIGPSGRISPAAPYAPRQGLDLRPVIAVLPFKERADGGADAFGDALAEDISRALSRSRAFTVISHLSCRHYSAQRATLPQVTSALNPRFIITGEVRGEGDRFRASIDLHDAQTMHLLQSREHAGSRAAFFEGALDIALDVTTDASREASSLAGRAARARPLPSLALHELLMAAVGMMHGQDRDPFFRAKTLLDEALERAPNQAILHAWRAKWRVLKFMKGYAENKREEALVARRDSELALEIDQDSALALAFDGFVRSHLCGEMDLAQDRYRMAVEADENDAFAWLLFGTLHAFRDQSAEAVAFTERARKLSPLDPQRYYFDSLSATAYLADHRWEAALDYAERSLRGNRRHPSTLRVRIIALHHLGRYEESRRAVAELMRLEPGLTVSRYLANHPAAEYSTGKLWAETLEAAGIPR